MFNIIRPAPSTPKASRERWSPSGDSPWARSMQARAAPRAQQIEYQGESLV